MGTRSRGLVTVALASLALAGAACAGASSVSLPTPTPAPSVAASPSATPAPTPTAVVVRSAEELADRLADALEKSDWATIESLITPSGWNAGWWESQGMPTMSPAEAVSWLRQRTLTGKLTVFVERRPILAFDDASRPYVISEWREFDSGLGGRLATQRVLLLFGRADATASWSWRGAAYNYGTAAIATPAPSPTTPSSRPVQPTPFPLAVSGHVRMSDGRPVAGVRVRVAPFGISGGPAALAPGPDVVVTTDANGAYGATVSVWSLEALANSSSSQLSLFVTPPAGMKVVAMTQTEGFPAGPLAPNDPEWYFMLKRDLKGPIDITLAAQ